MAQPGREDVQDKEEGLSIGPLPHQSPDPIAAAFGLTNEQCSVTYEKQALEGVARAVEKAAERGPDPFKGEKAVVQGSTAYRAEEEDEEQDPTKRDYKERDFNSDFLKWMTKNGSSSVAVELKVSSGDSLSFDKVEPHQIANLLKAKHGNFAYKIADDSSVKAQRPFDCFMLSKVKSFIGIMFMVKERGQKEFFLIDIDVFLKEKKESDRKSITKTRCSEIGFLCHL